MIGAQAIYLHTGETSIALAAATKDSDLAVDPRLLDELPLLEEAMSGAGFHRNLQSPQPGSWLSPGGIPVDLMVPEALAGAGSRGAHIPPHDRRATRRAVGLEAALVDHSPMEIVALADDDPRVATVGVAGPAALLVAKLNKLSERREQPHRLVDKDAHDVYRLLVAVPSAVLASRINELTSDDLAGDVTRQAVAFLDDLFASGATALGSAMAGRAEELIGDPSVVAAASAALAGDVLAAIGRL